MIKLQLEHQCAFPWFSNGNIWCKGFLFDMENHLYKEEALLHYFENVANEAAFEERIRNANGQFAVIVQNGEMLWAATDRLRTFPLFYRQLDDLFLVSDEVDVLKSAAKTDLDMEAATIFRGTGYVTGARTLLKEIFQIQAGEYITLKDNILTKKSYHHFGSSIRSITWNEAQIELENILERVAERWIKLLNGRQAAISLSGGFDSRLLAYLLHKHHYPNVICFTYGAAEHNPEKKRAQKTAEQLGLPWHFIDYEPYKNQKVTESEDFKQYYRYAAQYVSKFYFSEYFAMQHLNSEHLLEKDAVICPGHSGDMIAGSHLRPYMSRYHCRHEVILDLLYQHFQLRKSTFAERRLFKNSAKNQLHFTKGLQLYQLYEDWDLKERQSKYIVNSCKLWEHNGFQYLLPLWDTELTDFFAALPFEYRLHAKLYRSVLSKWFQQAGILFPEDIQKIENPHLQGIKTLIKRIFPFVRKSHPLFEGDAYHFKTSALPFLETIAHPQELLSYNAIFTEWYYQKVIEEASRI